ncbi:hypothetical protein Tco_1365178, partial [Tanacetum coccineum]
FQVQPKASHMHAVKRIFRYLKGQPTLGLLYPKDSSLELIAYSNSDYAGASLDRKSTTGGCQFLGCRLVSWQCKKQTIVANSTTEAEYIAASKCCAQVLWLQNQLLNYGYNFMKTKIHMDNESAICVVKNPDSHSKTKHIEIRYHFIRDSYEKRLIEMVKIHTDYNVADLLTKAFDVTRFKFLIASIVDTAEQNFVLLVQKLVLLGSVSAAVARAIRCQFSNAARLILSTAKFGPYFSKDVFTMVMMLELKKIEANANFHQIVDFISSSYVHHSLTVSPTIYASYIEQFWNIASSTTVNDEKQIHATVDSKEVVVIEASIRSSLLFNDDDGTSCLTNEENFQNLALMGNLDNTKKKFLMYPRFLSVFLNDQIELGEPFNDVYPTPAHTQKVFSNMARKSAKYSGKITPLFDNMLVPHQASEGKGSEPPTEPQTTSSLAHHSAVDQPSVPKSSSTNDTTQDSRDSLEGTHGHNGDQELFTLCTNLSNRVLNLETAKNAQAAEILKLKKRIKKLKQKSKPVISHHRAYMRSVQRLSMKKRFGKKESVSKQGRKKAKPESTLDDNTVFDDLDADHGMDYMETEEDVSERKDNDETEKVDLTADTEVIAEDKGSGEKGENTEELVSAVVPKTVSAAGLNVSAARTVDSDVEPNIPSSTKSLFDDEDITMAQTLIKLKEEKAKEERAKEKGVTIKDTEDSDRPRTATERSVLTLQPLPKIDTKDKGKKVLEEETESDAE